MIDNTVKIYIVQVMREEMPHAAIYQRNPEFGCESGLETER